MRRAIIGVPAVVIAVGSALGGVAAAHSFSASTASLIGYEDGSFAGRVGSTHSECVGRRRVRLEKHTDAGLKVVGRTRSDEDGHWTIHKPKAKGTYWVVVRRRIETTNEHDHTCRRGGSATVTVE
jgi:hypothetical protein